MCDGYGSRSDFELAWNQGRCSSVYYNTLSWLDDGSPGYDLSEQQNVRNAASRSFSRLLDGQRGDIRDFNEPEFTDLQEAIYNTFREVPQSAVDALTDYCGSMTRDEIVASQAKLRFCGCYIQDTQDTQGEQIDRKCDPLCNRNDTVKLPVQGSSNSQVCDSTVCVIDNVTIVAAGGSGNVTLEQVCKGCTESTPCTCIISNIDVDDAFRDNGQVQVSQSCNPQTTRCYENDIEYNCSSLFNVIDGSENGSGDDSINWLLIIVVVILTILIIVTIIVIYRSYA